MNHSLIVTTAKDISLEYLLLDHAVVAYFDQSLEEFQSIVSERRYDVIYIRDPFNNPPFDSQDIKTRLNLIYDAQPGARYIDNAQKIEHVFFEDKWAQYQILKEFMAHTEAGKKDEVVAKDKIAKKRISARSRDILFTGDTLPSDDWIVQDMLAIKEELRVYAVGGAIISPASIKQSKEEDQKVKVIGVRDLTEDEREFAQKIVDTLPWIDFVGLDIVRSKEGLRLLEANRAPQFKKYSEITGVNIAKNLFTF